MVALDEEAIFQLARQIDRPGPRQLYLNQACGLDVNLRDRLDALLRAHDEEQSFLEQPAVQAEINGHVTTKSYFPGTPSHPCSEVSLIEAGTVIAGRYKLHEQIGDGGMGTVWMAEQSEPVRRRVAIKLIKPGMDSKQVLARFEAERQALAMMDHPNIAKVHDAGTTTEGRPFFVMELVKGVPITKYCDEHKLTPRQRLELFVPVCLAIQHAHQKGIIHRDIKPSNVLVAMYDDRPVPKVIDFGVAKATGIQLTEQTLNTGFGAVVGTVEYMSPEQAGFNQLDIDTRSDIYSLGVLLYELLTGTTPLTRKRAKDAALLEVLRLVREEEPPKPSTRLSTTDELPSIAAVRGTEPARLSKLVRGDLDWIVMKSLEKDRSRRYETANGFAADIHRYLLDEPVLACPPSAGYRFRKFVRRNKGPVLATSVILLCLIVGIVGTVLGLVEAKRQERIAVAEAVKKEEARAAEAQQRHEAETQRDRAQIAEKLATDRLTEVTKEKNRATAAERKAKSEVAIADAVIDFLRNDVLAEAAPDKNPRNKKVTVEEVLGRAAARVAGKFGKQPEVEAMIRRTIGETYRSLGDYPAAQPHLERALELNRRVLGEENRVTLRSMNQLAILYVDQSHYAKAEALHVKTAEISRRVFGEEDPGTLVYLSNLAHTYNRQGQYAKAESLFVKTLEVRRRVRGEEHAETLTCMINLALLYQEQRQYAKAEPLLVKTLEARRRVLGEENPDTLRSMVSLAVNHRDQGQYARAEPLFVKALEARRRVLGEENRFTLNAQLNLALLYQAQGRYAEAEPLFVQSLEVSRRVLGEDHRDTLMDLSCLAMLYFDQGQFAKAEPLFVQTMEGRRRVVGEAHFDTLRSMLWLGDVYQARGELAKAERIYREVLEKTRKHQGESWRLTADALGDLGKNLLKQQKYADAEPLVREALNLREHKQPNDWSLFHLKSLLGGILLGQKKYADAEPLLLTGYEGMREREERMPAADRVRLTEALERLVQFYDAWDKKDRADDWRKKLDAHKRNEVGAKKRE